MIRMHLCQMFYLPSYYDNGFDLIEEPAPTKETSVTLGHLRQIDAVTENLIDFKAAYLEHITNKLNYIVQWCISRKTEVIVFPEYSIPVEALHTLHKIAKDNSILIVAGTHRIRITEKTKSIYQSIGINIDNTFNGSAIAPIMLPDGKVICYPKQSKSKWESNLNVSIQPGAETYPVELKGGKIAFAIAPCIDSLQITTLGTFWSKQGLKPNVLFCPSLSPSTSQFESIGNTLTSNETLFAFCNSAEFGGTTFNIPDGWKSYLEGNRLESSFVSAQTEAVLELDVELEAFYLKKGSVITNPPCKQPKEFLITYEFDNQWLGNYELLRKDIIEWLVKESPSDAIEWIDSALSDQNVVYPQGIVSKLKTIRHNQLPLYSGGIESIKDSLDLIIISDKIVPSTKLFAARIAKALKLTTDLILSCTDSVLVKSLLEYTQTLKVAEAVYGRASLSSNLKETNTTEIAEKTLARSKYVPSESILASFQNRGNDLSDLKAIINRASEKVIVVSGMPGIGKTELVKAFFLKLLPDWSPVWINIVPGSSVARVVSDIGSKIGVVMDTDSLSTVNDKIFRNRLSKIFDILFSLQRYAIIVDDLMDLRGNSRDYHHLQALIEEATKFEKFKGSRIFIISSVSSPPTWVQRAGVARLHLQDLEEKHVRRTIEYQLRASGVLNGEVTPDIPHKIFEFISGNPLVAKIVAEASREKGLEDLHISLDTGDIAAKAIDQILPKLKLSNEEQTMIQLLSLFRLPLDKQLLSGICDIKMVNNLTMKAIVDFDGVSYRTHPLIRTYYSDRIPRENIQKLHTIAVSYYDSISRKDRIFNYDDNQVLLETIHHLALAGNIKRISEIKANSYEELFSSAKKLYNDREYERALDLFISISELRSNEPVVWASIGRCYGRKSQWYDCDNAFQKAIECAEKLNMETWWIHRDWGHIRIRYNWIEEGRRHLNDAKKAGGKNNPSIIAAEAFMVWRDGDISEGSKLFENVLKIDPNHEYTLTTYAKLLETVGDEESLTRAKELREQYDATRHQMIPPRPYEIDDKEDEDI